MSDAKRYLIARIYLEIVKEDDGTQIFRAMMDGGVSDGFSMGIEGYRRAVNAALAAEQVWVNASANDEKGEA
jgi:hypothetical protein